MNKLTPSGKLKHKDRDRQVQRKHEGIDKTGQSKLFDGQIFENNLRNIRHRAVQTISNVVGS